MKSKNRTIQGLLPAILVASVTCGSPETGTQDQLPDFRYQTTRQLLLKAMVTDTDGDPVSHAVVAVRATNNWGSPRILARGITLEDGSSTVRLTIPTDHDNVGIAVLHPDYELARVDDAGVGAWLSGQLSRVDITLTPR